MSPPLTIRAFGPAGALARHVTAIATLPASLRLVADGPAEIALVAPDIDSILAGRLSGAEALVVADPAMLDISGSQALTDADIAVLPAFSLASALVSVDARGPLVGAAIVRSHLGWQGTEQEAVSEHLAALTALFGPLDNTRLLTRSGVAYTGIAHIGGEVELLWSGQAGALAPSYDLDVVGLGERLEVQATLDGSARPLVTWRGSALGLHQSSGVFESGLRLFWRRVLADRTGGSSALRWRDYSALLARSRELLAVPSAAHQDG